MMELDMSEFDYGLEDEAFYEPNIPMKGGTGVKRKVTFSKLLVAKVSFWEMLKYSICFV